MFKDIPGFVLYEMNQDKVIRNKRTQKVKLPHRGGPNIRLYVTSEDKVEATRKIDKLFDITFPELVEGIELPNYSKYKVRKNGDIYSKYEAKVLVPASTKKGYLQVSLIGDDGTTSSQLVHRLVSLAFLDKVSKYEELQVNHIDGNKSNNCVSNLEWCTNDENNEHAWKTGLYDSKYSKCKLSFDAINWIEFESTIEAAAYLNCPTSSLRTCLSKNRNVENKVYRCRGHIVLDVKN